MQDLRLHPEPALKQNKLKQTSVFPSRWDQALATAVYGSLSEGRSQKCEQQCEKWLSCFTTVLLSDLLEGFIRLHNRLYSWLRLFYRGYRVKAARKIYVSTDMRGPAKAYPPMWECSLSLKANYKDIRGISTPYKVWVLRVETVIGVLVSWAYPGKQPAMATKNRNPKMKPNVHHQTWRLCQGTEQAITAWAIVPGAKSWNQYHRVKDTTFKNHGNLPSPQCHWSGGILTLFVRVEGLNVWLLRSLINVIFLGILHNRVPLRKALEVQCNFPRPLSVN